MSTPVPVWPAAIAAATSPSRISRTFAPASRSSAINASWRSRSRTTTEISRVDTALALATALTFSVGEALMSTTSMPCDPTAIFSMYTAAPGKNIVPRSATAMTAIAFGWPSAVSRVPSRGSTATSTCGPVPSPTDSPLKSIGASSFSPGTLHPFGRLDSDQIQCPRDHVLRPADEGQPEGLSLGAHDAVLVVEAVEVVGHADRVDRDRMGGPPLGGLCSDHRELGEPLDQVALLARKLTRHRDVGARRLGVAQDPRDARMRVLHVVDRILLRALS